MNLNIYKGGWKGGVVQRGTAGPTVDLASRCPNAISSSWRARRGRGGLAQLDPPWILDKMENIIFVIFFFLIKHCVQRNECSCGSWTLSPSEACGTGRGSTQASCWAGQRTGGADGRAEGFWNRRALSSRDAPHLDMQQCIFKIFQLKASTCHF